MNNQKILIGVDTSLEASVGTEHARVYVQAQDGKVSITGPGEGWVGAAVLADLGDRAQGEALARRIAADPVAELPALGYDIVHWFRPVA